MNMITRNVIASAIEVHKNLGPGLLESVYQKCLAREFAMRNITFEEQKLISVIYKGLKISNCEYRIDFLVDNLVVVELKAVEKVISIHHAQILSYMKLGTFKLGLLINFNVPFLVKGVKRFIL